MDRPSDPDSLARSIVLRQLTVAPRSRKQLAAKLAAGQVPDDIASAVLDRFQDVGLIDDAEFARMWVRSRSQTKGLARTALRRELAEKGIAHELSEQALDLIDEPAELATAASLIQRKLDTTVDYADKAVRDKHTRRLVSMLARKGYPPGVAFRLVAEAIAELEAR